MARPGMAGGAGTAHGSLIGGVRRDGPEVVAVVDPADGRAFAEVVSASVRDCLDAVQAAADALPGWGSGPPRARSEVLDRCFRLLDAERESLATVVTRESGKPRREALAEIAYAAEFFRWYAEEGVRVGGEMRRSPAGDKRIMTSQAPVGVALLVTPWNFPLAMAARKLAPALAAGCTAVLKPASETPLTAFALAGLLARAGAPDGVVNVVVPEPPADAVAAMLRAPAVRKLSFTGSTAVGRHLLAEAARTVARVSMELGGNAPFLVLHDADLDVAVEAAVAAKMRNGGASCVAANRFYVHRSLVDDFVERLTERISALVVGDPAAPGCDVGPMISDVERAKVERLVRGAVARGARVRCGGRRVAGAGWFFEPTVLEVDADDPILRHEVFGPVAPVVAFDDEHGAIAAANATEAGLVAYVVSDDLAHALRVSDRLDVGMVGINRGIVSDAAAPFGGTKQSGLGREGGVEGIAEYLETKYVALGW